MKLKNLTKKDRFIILSLKRDKNNKNSIYYNHACIMDLLFDIIENLDRQLTDAKTPTKRFRITQD